MRWRSLDRRLYEKCFPPKWTPWFAWRPVEMDDGSNTVVWLEWLERRYENDMYGGWMNYRVKQ